MTSTAHKSTSSGCETRPCKPTLPSARKGDPNAHVDALLAHYVKSLGQYVASTVSTRTKERSDEAHQ